MVTGWSAVALLAAAPAAVGPEPVTVAAVTAPIPGSEKIGKRKAGFACLPAGNVQWRDVAATSDEMVAAAEEGLAKAGILIVPPEARDEAPKRGLRITATIKSFTADLCAKRWVMGRSGKFRGSGSATIAWRAVGTDAKKPLAEAELTEAFAIVIDGLPHPVAADAVKQSAARFGAVVLGKERLAQ